MNDVQKLQEKYDSALVKIEQAKDDAAKAKEKLDKAIQKRDLQVVSQAKEILGISDADDLLQTLQELKSAKKQSNGGDVENETA